MALQITFFQKLFSYILPVSILKTKSEFNSSLEVTVENGKLVLNSANANYSYGSLFKVFKKAFVEFNVDMKKANTVLMLGMGAGSVVKFIAEQNPSAKIDAIEIDESVIAIAEQVFEINKFPNIRVIHADAEKFLQQNNAVYDLILIDLFIDRDVPAFCNEELFAKQVSDVSSSYTKIIFNLSMTKTVNDKKPLEYFQKYFENITLKKIKGNTALFASQKK